jgi:hypothetical protein
MSNYNNDLLIEQDARLAAFEAEVARYRHALFEVDRFLSTIPYDAATGAHIAAIDIARNALREGNT